MSVLNRGKTRGLSVADDKVIEANFGIRSKVSQTCQITNLSIANHSNEIEMDGGAARPSYFSLHKLGSGDQLAVMAGPSAKRLMASWASSNMEVVDVNGRTMLHNAAMAGNQSLIKSALIQKTRIEARDSGGRTPLSLAVSHDKVNAVACLLAEGANPEGADYMFQAPLHLVGSVEILEQLLNQGVALERRDSNKRTPLHSAAKRGVPVQVMEKLLEEGASTDVKDNLGQFPIHLAAVGDFDKLVEVLLKHKADCNGFDTQGRTVFAVAAENGSVNVMALLLGKSYGNPHIPDRHQRSPLHLAAGAGEETIALYLLNAHVSPNDRDELGRNALHFAAKRGNALTVQVLIAFRCQPDAKDNFGTTPIDHAGLWGNSDVLKALFKSKAALSAESLADLITHDGHGASELVDTLFSEPSDSEWNRESQLVREAVMNDTILAMVGPRHLTTQEDTVKKVLKSLFHKAMLGGGFGCKRQQCELHLIESLRAQELLDLVMIKALAGTPVDDIVETDFAVAIVSLSWVSIYGRYLMNTALLVTALVGLLWATSVLRTCPKGETLCEHSKPLVGPAILLLLKVIQKAVDCFWHVSSESLKAIRGEGDSSFLVDPQNWLDLGSVVLDLLAFVALIANQTQPFWKSILASSCAAQWVTIMYQLRLIPFVGHRILPILYACLDTWSFFCVLSICIVGSVHTFLILGIAHGPAHGLYASFYNIANLVLTGKTSSYELEGAEIPYTLSADLSAWTAGVYPKNNVMMYRSTQVFYFAVTITMHVILLELLVAVLQSNYSFHWKKSRAHFIRHRAAFIIKTLESPWTHLLRKSRLGRSLIGITPNRDDHIWACRTAGSRQQEQADAEPKQTREDTQFLERLNKEAQKAKRVLEEKVKDIVETQKHVLEVLNSRRGFLDT